MTARHLHLVPALSPSAAESVLDDMLVCAVLVNAALDRVLASDCS